MTANGYLDTEYDELTRRQDEQWSTVYDRECKTTELQRKQLIDAQMSEQRKAIMTVFETTMAALASIGK